MPHGRQGRLSARGAAMHDLSMDDVRNALTFISPDCGHDERARLAGSIYSEFAELGRDAWMDWAGSRSKPDLAEDRSTWKSARRFTKVKIATLIKIAQDGGYKLPATGERAEPDREALRKQAEERQRRAAAAEAEYRARADQAARDAWDLWTDGTPDVVTPYLQRKGVPALGTRALADGTLLVPMVDVDGKIQNVQRIAPRKPEGEQPEKRFMAGGRKSGLFHLIGCPLGVLPDEPVLLLAEGYATAASIHAATGYPIAVCFDAGNIKSVVEQLRTRCPALPMLVCGDDDASTLARTGHNPGREKAASAVRKAVKLGGPAAEVFPADLPEGGTDFNDMHHAVGLEAVADVVEAAVSALLAAPQVAEESSPPPSGEGSPADDRQEPPAEEVVEAAAPPEGEEEKASPEKKDRKKKLPPEFWELVDRIADRYTLVYGTDTAWDGHKRILIKVAHMRLAHGSDPIKFWLARPSRKMVSLTDLVFEPGQDVGEGKINMFGGLVLQPVPATADDVAPMLDLLRHLCSESAATADEVDTVMHWVLCWLALPLQRIGSKMQTALVFHGAQGTGKNLFFDLWRDLYDEYGITVGQTEIEDKFNGWVSKKLAIIGDEVVSRQEMYHRKNALKSIVTQLEKFPIRGMMQETRWESNHANVVFCSNESMPLALEERDRRYMVVYTPLEADAEVYQAVRDFKRAGGAAKWLHYLQAYDLGDFDEHTKPIMTRAKQALIERNWRASVRFANDWLNGFLSLPVRVCSGPQLYKAFRRWADLAGERFPSSRNDFTHEVSRWADERRARDPVTGRLEEPALVCKTVTHTSRTNERKSIRTWVPKGVGAPDGVSEGAWAWESALAFEAELGRFCRENGMGEGEDE